MNRKIFPSFLLVLALPGCAAAPPEALPAPPPTPTSRAQALASAKVYDAAGRSAPCARPEPTCPDQKPDIAFHDRCRLAGFQVRQCGCDMRCSGDVSAAPRRYDAAGNAKECAPATADCTPPPPSAAFQDACAEKGHRLVTCGCEWLCTGKPR